MSFRHPFPSCKFHMIFVAKRQINMLVDFDPADETLLSDPYLTVQSLADEFKLIAYRFVVNGGEHQDFLYL